MFAALRVISAVVESRTKARRSTALWHLALTTRCSVRLGALALCAIALSATPLVATPSVDLGADLDEKPLGRSLEYFVDEGGELGLQEVAARAEAWRTGQVDFPTFGFSPAIYWVRVRFENPAKAPLRLLLEQGYPLIDSLRVYQQTATGWHVRQVGDHTPFALREVQHRNFIIPVDFAPGTTTLYLRYETDSAINVHLRLWRVETLLQSTYNEQVALGVYYGIILVMLVYNFFLFVSLRDWSYLQYVAFIAGFGLYQSTLNGLTFQYLWPNAVWWGNASLPFFMFSGVAAAKLFTRSLLSTVTNAPWLDRALRLLMFLTASLAPVSLLLPYRIGILAAVILVLVSVVLMFAAGVITALRRYAPAYYYLTAWTTLLFGVLAYIAKTAGVLPDNFFTNWSQQIGSALEVVLLSLALGARISLLRESNERAQAALIERQKESLAVQRQMADSFARFVPRQFLSFLERQSVTDIRLGDQVQKEMTILFADIRDFTQLSEQMSPAENFNFLNAYLKRLGPIVRKHNGFIDKFIGDAIMALFPESPDDAVRTAIELQQEIRKYNRLRIRSNFDPVRVGIGIHTGKLILGVIGEHERMETTVISDAVNLAARIESITKRCGASILVSENTLFRLDNPNAYRLRMLGRVRLKGKVNTVAAFEIFDGQADYVVELLGQTRAEFELGVSEYYGRQFEKAILHFGRCLETFPNDVAADVYLKAAHRAQRLRTTAAD